MAAVKSSEFQKNVGFWLERSSEGPVKIERYDRPVAVLVSAAQYEELITNYRKVVTADQLSETELALIQNARVSSSKPFSLADIPELPGQ